MIHLQRTLASPRPARRMLCLRCAHLAEPDTVLEGSDRVELLAWSLGVLPGALYCAWRHGCRAKRCEACGSGELMRESRAMAQRHPGAAPRAAGPRVRPEQGPAFPWPPALRTPRGRLARGGPAMVAMGIAWALVVLTLGGSLRPGAFELAGALALGAVLWCVWQLQPMAWQSDPFDACTAWDPHGREIRIERA